MPKKSAKQIVQLSELFPSSERVLLTGGGKEFVERLGVEAIRDSVCSVMLGENLRTQTEPLSRRRIAQVSGALIALFTQGYLTIDGFEDNLSAMAVRQLQNSKRNDKATVWPAQWLIGLNGKAFQNVLKSDPATFAEYVADFEEAIQDAARHCREQIGDFRMKLGYYQGDDGKLVELDWVGITRLTTAIGAQTLTIRGSDKSIYGKLFERLVLGSFLEIMGFARVDPSTNTKTKNVFWLSDSSDVRESDATLLLSPGRLARFDIGFIGPGNSEISKDKLSRFAREIEHSKGKRTSVTFIVVDRLPKTGKTELAAKSSGTEIVQMSMQYWPRDLAQRLGKRLGFKHEIQTMGDHKLHEYIRRRMQGVAVQNFLAGVKIVDGDVVE